MIKFRETKKPVSEKILQDRKLLNEYIKLLYVDRSKINLLNFRVSEIIAFLNCKALCRECTKEKSLRCFYNKEQGTIADICNKCKETKLVLSVLTELIRD